MQLTKLRMAKLLILSGFLISSCTPLIGVKVYSVQPEYDPPLVRLDDDGSLIDSRSIPESKGYLCASPNDIRTIMERLKACQKK